MNCRHRLLKRRVQVIWDLDELGTPMSGPLSLSERRLLFGTSDLLTLNFVRACTQCAGLFQWRAALRPHTAYSSSRPSDGERATVFIAGASAGVLGSARASARAAAIWIARVRTSYDRGRRRRRP